MPAMPWPQSPSKPTARQYGILAMALVRMEPRVGNQQHNEATDPGRDRHLPGRGHR
jgi:hypothetical protein